MDHIAQLFDRMDSWRHLPNYQLERRADLFFAPYLPAALEAKVGFKVRPELIPEFPVRIGTIYPSIPINKSFKIDYLALSAAGDRALFVELKTEGHSRRPKQDRYLSAACEAGLFALLEGLLTIFRATTAKRKYFCLLDRLARIGLLHIPDSMREIMNRDVLQGIEKSSRDVAITCPVVDSRIVYVQPTGTGSDIISFQDFRAVVERYDDPVSRRFAQSLREWADVPAGGRASNTRVGSDEQ